MDKHPDCAAHGCRCSPPCAEGECMQATESSAGEVHNGGECDSATASHEAPAREHCEPPRTAGTVHIYTDRCGYDRSASINEDRDVCMCGWRADAATTLPLTLEQKGVRSRSEILAAEADAQPTLIKDDAEIAIALEEIQEWFNEGYGPTKAELAIGHQFLRMKRTLAQKEAEAGRLLATQDGLTLAGEHIARLEGELQAANGWHDLYTELSARNAELSDQFRSERAAREQADGYASKFNLDCQDAQSRAFKAEQRLECELAAERTARKADREELASLITSVGFATGHGEMHHELLCELAWQIKEVQDRLAAMETELTEEASTRDRMRDILTRTANELKGHPEGTFEHDWSDLQQKVYELKDRLRDAQIMLEGEHDCRMDAELQVQVAKTTNLNLLHRDFGQICSYCGWESRKEGAQWEELQAHIKTCSDHPLFKAEQRWVAERKAREQAERNYQGAVDEGVAEFNRHKETKQRLAAVETLVTDWRTGDSADHYNRLRDVETALAAQKDGKP